MSESNIRICKKCGEPKVRTEAGLYPDGRCKKHVDDKGKLWNGSTCADCNVKRAKETMKKQRADSANKV